MGILLSNSVFVKLPCGSKWKMKFNKKNDDIWLEKGWPDFAKHYSIKRGSMLNFRYEWYSVFHIVIFDTSTVEIDYPSKPVNFDEFDVDLELRAPRRKLLMILLKSLMIYFPAPKQGRNLHCHVLSLKRE